MASKIKTELKKAIEIIGGVKSDLEEKFDNASDSWKESERGDECLEKIDALQKVIDALEEVE